MKSAIGTKDWIKLRKHGIGMPPFAKPAADRILQRNYSHGFDEADRNDGHVCFALKRETNFPCPISPFQPIV